MRVIIAGGGTGGHVFPGIALARALEARGDAEILFVGTPRGLETKAVPGAGFRVVTVSVRQVRGGGIRRAITGGAAAVFAVIGALRVIRRFRPDVVVGVGGYASVPMVLAARLTRIPTMLLEQNVIPGATNRLLGRFARVVCISFPETATSFAGTRVVCTGNPVRPEVVAVGEEREQQAAAPGSVPPTLLVVGGSAGAHRLNTQTVDALALLGARAQAFHVIHQTGDADAEATRAQYGRLGIDADVQPFFGDMALAYRAADLALCRAGATTIAELLAVGVPAILVPYPYAADDHQRRNAEAVVAAGAGVLILDRELTSERLARELGGLLRDGARLREMAAAARTMGRPRASWLVAEECAKLAGAGS